MAETRTLPGGGINTTVYEEPLEAAIDDWMEMAPQQLVDYFDMIESKFGEEAARRDAREIIESALMSYHSALHEMQSDDG